MRTKIAAIALAAALLSGAARADGPLGVWKTQPKDDGRFLHVEIAPCADGGAALCGTAVGAFGGAKDTTVGKRIFWDMAPDGTNEWSGGTVWAADEDKTYSGKIALTGTGLEISGCVLGGLICRGQDWTRVN